MSAAMCAHSSSVSSSSSPAKSYAALRVRLSADDPPRALPGTLSLASTAQLRQSRGHAFVSTSRELCLELLEPPRERRALATHGETFQHEILGPVVRSRHHPPLPAHLHESRAGTVPVPVPVPVRVLAVSTPGRLVVPDPVVVFVPAAGAGGSPREAEHLEDERREDVHQEHDGEYVEGDEIKHGDDASRVSERVRERGGVGVENLVPVIGRRHLEEGETRVPGSLEIFQPIEARQRVRRRGRLGVFHPRAAVHPRTGHLR